MMSPLVRRALIAAFIACVSISGCKCGSKVVGQGCQSDDECKAEFNNSSRAFCDQSQNPPTCELHPQKCDTANDCCPAQVCNATGHYCFDKYTPCTQDSECPSDGQVCKEIGVFSKGLGCTWNKCDANGGCADPSTTCFNHYCVGTPPCNGGCTSPTSPVCVTTTNLCTPAPKDSTCAQTCPTGKVLVLTNPDNIFDTCVESTEKCECDSLPPLIVHDVSRYSSIAGRNGDQNLYVSAYDGEYGDLVLHTFDKNSLDKPTKTEWLDGVPTTCKIGGDVTGPRGGCVTPGPNVGQYTSIAESPTGDLYIAYYDVDNGDLKFIARYGGPAASWTTPVTIDGSTPVGSSPSNGDVGLYASIALDKTGVPAIAYFRRGDFNASSGAEDGPSTGLVYAYAKRTQPLTAADWQVVGDVEALNRPPPVCGGPCPTNQLCVQDGALQQCEYKSPSCTAACGTGQACVLDQNTANASPACRTTLNDDALPELPRGVGLMPQLGFIDGTGCNTSDKGCPVIAYYASIGIDPADGKTKSIPQLKAVLATAGGAAPVWGTPVVLDGAIDPDPQHAGQTVPSTRDTGRWPSLAIGPVGAAGGRIAIAFQDRTSQQLLIYQDDVLFAHASHAPPGGSGLIHVVDGGLPDQSGTWHPQSFPGAQTSIAFTASGKIALAYQDATPVDLIFSVYDPSALKTISRVTLQPSGGAAGFWPHMAIVSGTAYVESATIKALSAKRVINPLHVAQTQVP